MSNPKVEKTNEIDRLASKIFEKETVKYLLTISNEGNTDFGIDYFINIIDKKYVTSHFLAGQLKGHKSMTFNKNGYYKQSVKITTAKYWLNSNIPVMAILVDNSTEKIYVCDVCRRLRSTWNSKNNKSISFRVYESDILIDINSIYRVLISSIDYSNMFSFRIWMYGLGNIISYMKSIMNRDWFLLVDEYDDRSEELIAIIENSFLAVSNISNLANKYKEIMQIYNKYLFQGTLDYYACGNNGGFIEQVRKELYTLMFYYFKELVNIICWSMDMDKTKRLEKKLFLFRKYKEKFDKYPNFDSKEWNNVFLPSKE